LYLRILMAKSVRFSVIIPCSFGLYRALQLALT
jgi:hypothetical protein